MIYSTLIHYLLISSSIVFGGVFIILIALYWRLRVKQRINSTLDMSVLDEQMKEEPKVQVPKTSHRLTITSHDISAIAGDDVFTTQLDLARAYLEIGRKQLAKKILDYVAEQGSDAQQSEARKLLGLI